MLNFENFKRALKKREEERFEQLKAEVRKVKATIEKLLTMFFESTACQSQTKYSGLDMY